ncbi:chemotaxis protein CheW [Brevibacillus humidisoli]|uniref:chemotaxis protein CheW n=1 Tax=Brevibacillus humidisoli TaxID=2895522 RepID=UPI001E317884|nr:chemotaxis protein CheW [Brevibacillus humidisoli]UFJ41683.1 chemotaxis protein CheW [Brevibacillus humidisoli]
MALNNNPTVQDGVQEEEQVQTILFHMGDEHYGLPTMLVKEIIKPLPVTRFPKSPPYVEGVIDLRGKILPIVDLRKMFGLEPQPLTDASRFVDIELEGFRTGIIVDAVSEVVQIPVSQIEPAPPIVAGVDGRYLRGVARLNDKLVLLLDPDEIFSMWKHK